MSEELWMELACSLGKNLLIIGIGVLLCFIASRLRFNLDNVPSLYMLFSFVLLTCQYGGALFYQATSGNGNLGDGFQLMEPATWNTKHWIMMVGGGVILLGLVLYALAKRHFEWLLVLVGLALMEYSLMELILVLFSEGDGFFVEVIWWAISSAYNLYVSVVCMACVFGPFLPRIGGGGTPRSVAAGAPEEGESGSESARDLSRLPNIMYDSANNRWQKGWTSYDHVTYRNDDGEEITIWHAEISGHGALTSEGNFHW